MPELVKEPKIIESAGNNPKLIEHLIGRVNPNDPGVSVARLQSPSRCCQPGQRPDFDEYTIVLHGTLRVESENAEPLDVQAGQAVIAKKGEWVRYSTPTDEGAEYVAVCLPAFSPDSVHRDEA